jgi:hypothetical protein
MCIESLHSKGYGANNSEPIIASLPSNEQQTLILLLLCAFRGFYGLNSYCMGETRHNIKGLHLKVHVKQFFVIKVLMLIKLQYNVTDIFSF